MVEFIGDLAVTVGNTFIQNRDTMPSFKTEQRIKVFYPFKEEKYYIIFITQERDHEKYIYTQYLSINVEKRNGILHKQILRDFPIVESDSETTIDHYNVCIYSADRYIDISLEQYESNYNEISLILEHKHHFNGISLRLEDQISFSIYSELIPGSLTWKNLRYAPRGLIWKLISDYNIDMGNTSLTSRAIIEKLLEWQKTYVKEKL